MKIEKGITLISLIITIVVLLILATVVISSIGDDKVIEHTNNTATEFNELQNKENELLQQYKDNLKAEFK